MKSSKIKPWNKLGISRREYLAAKPWKEQGMSRAGFEKFLFSIQQDVVADSKLKRDSLALREQLFGRTRG